MYRKILCIISVILWSVILNGVKNGWCYRVPPEKYNNGFFYVFGQNGKKTYGATKKPFVLFLRVPVEYKGKINVSIYDPDVGGYIDEKSGRWDTRTHFYIFGGEKAYSSIAGVSEAKITNFKQGILLAEKTFGEDKEYDRKTYNFAPIDATKGEKVGKFRYFKVVIEGMKGNDNNVFSLDISPVQVETFSYALPLRLPEQRGSIVSLYPEIPSGTTGVIEYNYDMDYNGGEIELISPTKSFDIHESKTGMWENTKLKVPSSDTGKRWVYEITKGTQRNANMAMYLTTSDGHAVPIFLLPGAGGPKQVIVAQKPPEEKPWMESKLSCKTFTFDASKSYDPDNQALTYFWDFGDGATDTQIRTMHTYKEAGKYLVKLTVTDSSTAECNSATTQQVIKVNEPPCAVASGPDLACVNTEILFDGTSSTDSPEDTLTYRWDFGDGTTKEGAKVKHKYTKGGNYLVTLTVTDDSGSMCDTGVDRLNVNINTPPVADAGKDIILCKKNPNDTLEVTFNASKSSDADGDKLNYLWDFGDGQTAEGKVVTHKYEKGGEYIAKLLVTDNTDTECNKAVSTTLVTLNRAPSASAGQNLKLCLSDTAHLDASASFDNDGDTLSYDWDFGDGQTATGKKVTHKYAKGGLYKVTVKVDDNTGTDCSLSTHSIVADVNSSPTAEITARETSCVNRDVMFDASLSADPDGDKLSYMWDFGDGTTATGSAVKHSFAKGGLYKTTLFVDDGRDSDCSGATKTHYIKVNTPPIAKAGKDLVACVNTAVEFDGTRSFDADNDKLTYMWDFGDGQTAEGPRVSHTYKDIGVYKVTLKVVDDSGTECNKATDTLVATVNAEPVPVIEVI